MQYEYSPMQLAEITDFSFLKEWDTIRIMPEGYDEEARQGWYAPDGEPYLVDCKHCYIVHAIGEGRDGCIDGGEARDRWFTNS